MFVRAQRACDDLDPASLLEHDRPRMERTGGIALVPQHCRFFCVLALAHRPVSPLEDFIPADAVDGSVRP